MNLGALDLNLLRALDALLAEGSVTRAGRRLGLSQPATSNALARLRAVFDDPLLVRTPAGMQPTPRGKALAKPLAKALADLAAAIAEPRAFDPRTAEATLSLGVTDYVALVVVPPLVKALQTRAPHIDLRIETLASFTSFAPLSTGELDLAIARISQPPARLATARVFRDRLVTVVRRGHRLANKKLTLAEYAAAEHIVVAVGAAPSQVDDALAAKGLARRIALRVPHFTVVPLVVLASDMIATVPERLAAAFAPLPLVIAPPPLALPGFEMHLAWHQRRDGEPAHRFVRELITNLFG